MDRVSLGHTGLVASVVGLGCSRLGSTLSGCDGAQAVRLLRQALESGISLFDTADIYGQGDSERLIGTVLRGQRSRAVIVTKVGQRFTTMQRAAAWAKRPLRRAVPHVPALQRAIGARRAMPLPRDFSPHYLQRAVQRSLHRLGTEAIDVLLLHSPCAAEVHRQEYLQTFTELVRSGAVRAWGVSCDDAATALASLGVAGVSVLQVPMRLLAEESVAQELGVAVSRGIGIMLREVFASSTAFDRAARDDSLRTALAIPGAVTLIGTTQPAHLDAALAVARARSDAVPPAANPRKEAFHAD